MIELLHDILSRSAGRYELYQGIRART